MGALFRLSLIFVLCSASTLAPAQGRPADVSTRVVAMQSIAETVSLFGEVVAGRESAVAARVAGVAAEVPLRVGQTVQQGDVLAQLDTELLEIELAQAEAQIAIAEAGVAVARARLDRAKKALDRTETLRANSTVSEAQLEERAGDYNEALGSLQEASARIAVAQTALEQARYRLKNATVTAPFDAVVLQVATEVGQFISAGSEVATLLDIEAMEVEANVPARFVNGLQPDQIIQAITDTESTLELELRAILPTEFSTTRTRPVRFRVASPTTDVAIGQSVTLDVPVSAPRDVIVVPKDALVQSRGGWSVFLNEDGVATPRTVEIGMALGDGFEVLSGLAPSDVVVVRGNERLRPGQEIAPIEAPADGEKPGTRG